jgi:predicted MPP superfamily phosphohydrolase
MSNDKKTTASLKAFIISDLHAFDAHAESYDPDKLPSYLDISQPDAYALNPLTKLQQFIRTRRIVADILICCGDMGDKAHPTSIKYVWAQINELKNNLGAKHIIATVGNHDVDSRYKYNQFDAKGFIQSLEPPFPDLDENHSNRFWAQHFTIYNLEQMRIVLLNSSAYHGYNDEFEHGRISDATLTKLKEKLQTTPPAKVNVFVCHHHPRKHAECDVPGYSEMKNGQGLLDILGSGDYGEWIVVHGHIHFPALSYAAGGASAPVIFSSGSLAARLYSQYGTKVRNQCYEIEFPIERISQVGLVGKFLAWDWSHSNGWTPASSNSGLPYKGGFGCRTKPLQLGALINKLLKQGKRLTWEEICKRIPGVGFLIPSDVNCLVKLIKNQHSINTFIDETGVPQELEKP